MDFLAILSCDTNSQGGATVLALLVWRSWQLKRSYSTLGPVSTAMGDCLRLGNAIDFRVSREHKLKFLVIVLLYTSALATILNKKKLLTDSLALGSNKWPQL